MTLPINYPQTMSGISIKSIYPSYPPTEDLLKIKLRTTELCDCELKDMADLLMYTNDMKSGTAIDPARNWNEYHITGAFKRARKRLKNIKLVDEILRQHAIIQLQEN